MAAGRASIRIWPFADTSRMDRSMAVRPDPPVALEPAADAGPVVVRTTYSIPAERELEFIRAMGRVRGSRLRTGATQWGLFRDGEQPRVFEEIFVVASWEEHLRQHRERMTATDRGYEEEAKALSDTPPANLAPPSCSGRLVIWPSAWCCRLCTGWRAGGSCPRQWLLVGNGRGDITLENFRARVHDALTEFGPKPAGKD